MERKGLAYARAYMFPSKKNTIYLDSLSVSDIIRNQGYGTWLQEIREELGISLGCKYACLWVKKGSWQRKWYARRGYKYFAPYKKENAVWLRKKL